MDPALLELIAAGNPDDDVAIIVRTQPGRDPPAALRVVARFGDIATGRARRGMLAAIHDDPAVASLKAPRVYAAEVGNPFGDRPPPIEPGASEADPAPVESDLRRPPGLRETGAGTVVAVIDWGIDFAHADFRDDTGRTRLLALWDQRATGSSPSYGYGRVHRREAIDRALAAADPFAALGYRPAEGSAPSHGTHVMGIAAGNGRAGGPEGIAPEADLVFVHLGPGLGDLGNSIDLLEAVDFVVRTAGERPVAINLSIGRHAGPHDGSLLVERAIDWLIVNRPGTVVVQSAGNYFARNTHMEGRLHEARTSRLPFILPISDAQPVTVELWYKGEDRFHARAVAPDGTSVDVPPGANAAVADGSGNALGRLYHRLRDPNNGDNLIALILRPLAPAGKWRLEITGIDVVDGRWHAWIERNAANPRAQAQFAPRRASPNYTTGSICHAMRTIAVGAYDGHDPAHQLALFSSVGPTRDGRRKPLLAAPGVRVLSVRSRRSADEPMGYVRMSGTSMAAPHVTGTAALMLQAAGRQPIAAIRQALFATLSPQGPAPPGQIERWGYGMLNIEAAVAAARRLTPPAPHRQIEIEEYPAMAGNESETATTAPALPTMAGPPVADEERRWTRGRNAQLMSPERRVLSQFSDAELRDMLDLPPAPPIVVASAEADPAAPVSEPAAATTLERPGAAAAIPAAPPQEPAVTPAPTIDPAAAAAATAAPPVAEPTAEPAAPLEPAAEPPTNPPADPPKNPAAAPAAPPDPQTLIKLAVNPQVPSTQVVGFPGARLAVPLLAGDIILRGQRKRRARIVRRPGTRRRSQLARRPGRPRESGYFAEVFGGEGEERIAGPDGMLLPDVTIIRSLGIEAQEWESDPPLVARPTVRSGSRGPAVMELQTRLNALHARRLAEGLPGLERCPLTVDGAFGPNTRAALVAYQRIAFPQQPQEWDGVAGPRTWAALIAASEGADDQAVLPTRCPGLPLQQTIDQFAFNSSDILPRHQPQIVGIARCILESQRTATPIRHLLLVGHTDPVGSDAANVALGLRRAEAVRSEILTAVVRISGRPAPAGLVIDVDSRCETLPRGSDAENRRVEVISDFAFDPAAPPPPPVQAAQIEFVLDDNNDRLVDGRSPVATALMFGLWNDAYDAAGDIRNGAAAADSFIDRDQRRFYLRVRDAAATGTTVTAIWRTTKRAGTDFDSPADATITLTRVAPGVFVSRALMLVTNTVDTRLRVHGGLASGLRRRGQSDYRLRRATLDGNVVAEYAPAGRTAVDVTLPVFSRSPDLRRKLKVNVVHYGITPDAAIRRYIDAQLARAEIRWMQTGLQIVRGDTIDRAIVASARDAAGNYIGHRLSQTEADACNDLMTVIPDTTVTVCFTRLPDPRPDPAVPFNAYATRGHSPLMNLGERYFIFINLDLDINDDTLAHELHHVIHNRGDGASGDQFFTFNTNPPNGIRRVADGSITLPDARIYHRVQMEHGDPDNDPRVECTTNWMRRRRTRRFNTPGNTHPGGFSAPDATTGNILTEPF